MKWTFEKGLLPTRLEMEYFYFYKSCDVKLLRRLIYETRLKGSKSFGSLSDWRYFDLVTEVNDDVADILKTYHLSMEIGLYSLYGLDGER